MYIGPPHHAAIERVAMKRHIRALRTGATLRQADNAALSYLANCKVRHAKSPQTVAFIGQIERGFTYPIKEGTPQ